MVQEVKDFALKLSACAGKSEEEGALFVSRLENYPDVEEEFTYFYMHKDFLCKYKVEGYSIVDLLVWQVDHFKAFLDRPDEMNRYNQDRLVWSAFDSFLQMKGNAQKYVNKLSEQTGTDFEGKNFVM